MIFKAFKERSNQKYVNKLLKARQTAINNKKITSIGVILNAEEFNDYEGFRSYFKALGLISPKHKIVSFSNDNNAGHNQWDAVYTPKDFGWNGKINSNDLQLFLDTDFDALICYYKESSIQLDQLALMSKANFKIGISIEDERFYDLIIDVKPKEFDVFKVEFKKYITILNKL
ncbi:MAG: hypothetical protein AAF901_04370 [Bacteroidota bacterium]